MAEDASNNITMVLEMPLPNKHFLGQIRHWENLKVAIDKDCVWVKDFTETQFVSKQLKAIPFEKLYYIKENLLFPQGSLLPAKKMPVCLWTPIERALPIELPSTNHNFFNLPQKINVKLVPAELEQQATAMLVDVKDADVYMQSAPAIRLKHLQWTMLDGNKALIIGEPLLPITGKTYWMNDDFIFPLGCNLEFPFLAKEISLWIDKTSTHVIFWLDASRYCLLPKAKFSQLGIASWRASTQT